ncbi:conserved hypothetical protein [Formosa agariphila KMM 3901]|uniref:Uncharacterized protein n=1 Tax=Formosa agariphila (strain DSM 15362 / KCTC 12365 / LMG 23005 / KMM 3901 / M-2Alg 35-1) TaxID=1347342 RepID=T2KNQ8_FORAG|nr:hypothetical protein [Formosa agariphila]CDF79629.1 conserved hypothetical protein [Formosa agariphila KMM 3901]
MDYKTMLQLPVLDTNEVINILQEIADIERKEDRPRMPKVTICTHGDSATGFFVNYDAEKKVVFLCDIYDRDAQFQYIAVHTISSISLSNINKYGYLLSKGKIPFTPDSSEIPTGLQLKKDIKALELEFKDALGKDISIMYKHDGTPEDLDKYYASKVISLLKETLSKIASDHLAKEAFTAAISTVEFALGNKNTSTLNKNVVALTIDITKGLKSFPKAITLQSLIEKGL